MPSVAFPIYLFRHLCCRMYRLVTIYLITARQIDRWTDIIMIIADHTAWQYNWLNTEAAVMVAVVAAAGGISHMHTRHN